MGKRQGNILIILLGIGLVVAAGIAGYFYRSASEPKLQPSGPGVARPPVSSSSADPTVNWKLYSLKDFSFRYPNDWSPEYQEIEPGSVTDFKYVDKDLPPLELNVFENSPERIKLYNSSGKVYASPEGYLRVMYSNRFSLNELSQVMVASQTASKISDPGIVKERLPYQAVAFFSPDKSYIVSFFYQPALYRPDMSTDLNKPLVPDLDNSTTWLNPKAEPVLDQILSTFKFLEPGTEGKYCGGFMEEKCPSGYRCVNESGNPAPTGKCVKNWSFFDFLKIS